MLALIARPKRANNFGERVYAKLGNPADSFESEIVSYGVSAREKATFTVV